MRQVRCSFGRLTFRDRHRYRAAAFRQNLRLAWVEALSRVRKRRPTSAVAIWLRFDHLRQTLTISEARPKATAMISASGQWPPAGATVDLYMLRNTVRSQATSTLELCVLEDSVVIPIENGRVPESVFKSMPVLN